MSNVAQCFRDHETSARSALGRMHEEIKEKTNPTLAKLQVEFDERQNESFKTVMEHVERYVKAALRYVRKECAVGLGELNTTL
eukprot:10600687-Lingulodinium_polyedra.AAC.1